MPFPFPFCSAICPTAIHTKRAAIDAALSVIPLGLEPKTYCLEGSCSIQLSYGTIKNGCKSNAFRSDFQIIW